ncbi:MAG: ABC transporter permease [Blastocatellia bacterium]
MELLDGSHITRRVPVVNTVNDLIGMSAYMEIGALNRLRGEGGTVSGLHLQVDKKALPELYARLKRTPAVRGVIVPGALLENFNQTLARTMGTSTATMIFFACVIALGVVYNSLRIALSERGRELASLRVLGFTRREVAVMLLGEQAILTTLALPLGWALGYALSWLIINAVDNELMRLPLNLSARTLARASLIVIAAALISSLFVLRRLGRLDLVEVLKTRE